MNERWLANYKQNKGISQPSDTFEPVLNTVVVYFNLAQINADVYNYRDG